MYSEILFHLFYNRIPFESLTKKCTLYFNARTNLRQNMKNTSTRQVLVQKFCVYNTNTIIKKKKKIPAPNAIKEVITQQY